MEEQADSVGTKHSVSLEQLPGHPNNFGRISFATMLNSTSAAKFSGTGARGHPDCRHLSLTTLLPRIEVATCQTNPCFEHLDTSEKMVLLPVRSSTWRDPESVTFPNILTCLNSPSIKAYRWHYGMLIHGQLKAIPCLLRLA